MSSEFRPDWKAYKLDELGFVGRGKSRHRPRNDPSLYGGSYPFFQTGDVKAANFYLKEYSQTYNEIGLAQSKLWKPGTLCITIAANIAETAILSIEGCFPDSIVGFIPDNSKADGRFVKYYLDTIKLRIQNVSHGATQDNLSLDKLALFDILLPPLPTQHKIASILSAYDDLIENNTRRIKILEEMAQTIYNEWFVKFRFPGHENAKMVDSELGMIPEGWEVQKVKDILKRLKAGNVYTESMVVQNGIVPVIDQSRSDYLGFHDNEADHKASPKNPIIVFGDHTCKMQLLVEPFSIGPNVVPFMSKENEVSIYYLYYLVNNLVVTREYKRHWTDLTNKTIPLANASISHIFGDVVEPVFQAIECLRKRNLNLCTTRDLLLPRLISGEIDVSELDINVGEMTE